MNEKKYLYISIATVVACILLSLSGILIYSRVQLRATRNELGQSRERIERLERELDRSTNKLSSLEVGIGRCAEFVESNDTIIRESRDTIQGLIETTRELRNSYEILSNYVLDLNRDLNTYNSDTSDSSE